MSVAELIELLKQQPQDLPVTIFIRDRAGIVWQNPCTNVRPLTLPAINGKLSEIISVVIS